MRSTTLITTNGNAAAAESSTWLQASVREFFGAFNWDDQPLKIQELKQSIALSGETTLSLTLTVGQFFGAIPWDGISGATPPPALLEIPPQDQGSSDRFTLDDFSSLF
ncbi:hypothetical protein BST81_08065 [Leptolyngbya sp. 'hensonii']|uniref:hypothetical protein n=1 Tax=Leptolyngbya sp. 'hensonii' TaxID=1922337 RepID=UPI00094FA87D|nr:hypothetical protein [Leptolyngbya sp. 'hensonii']OLP18863.1 hypothetical protein BST81_08065 [Leptolyngbya sp. 'hensonii']